MPRSVLKWVVQKKRKQEMRRKQIAQSKWVKRLQHKRQQPRICAIGNWNTRQLGATTGYIDQELKIQALTALWDARQWQIVCLTDTKLGAHTELETHPPIPSQWTLISRGKVTVALNQKWTQSWKDGRIPVYTDGLQNECRSMLLQIPCYHKLGLAIIATYAPSSRATRQDTQTYLNQLEHLLSKVHPRYTVIIAGDFNSEVGTRDQEFAEVLGPHGTNNRNTRGTQLLHFCQTQGLVVANTWTPQRNKTSWEHPRFGTQHLLDYYLVANKHLGNTHRVLTLHPQLTVEHNIPYWPEFTDHNPVELKLKLAPPLGFNRPLTHVPRPATFKGQGNTEEATRLRNEYQQQLQLKLDTDGIPQTWQLLSTLLTQTAHQVFGSTEAKKVRPWLQGRTAELNQLTSNVRDAHARNQQTRALHLQQPHNPHLSAQYHQASQALTQAKRRKRNQLTTWENEYWHHIGDQAEQAERRKDHYTLFSLMSKLRVRKTVRARTSLRNVTQNPFGEAQSWKQHFRDIQNGAIPVAERVWRNIPQLAHISSWMNDTPTTHELQKALTQMKLGKAPGDDGVTTEMLRWAPPPIQHHLFALVQQLWNQTLTAPPDAPVENWPQEWLQATVIPLWKNKHPKLNKNNWRGVVLLSVGSKLLARIVASRIQAFTESIMDEEQQGFRRNRSVDDVLQISRRLAEEISLAKGIPDQTIHLTLYDIEKAYPRINREALWEIMKRKGIPTGFIQICQGLHNHTLFHVRVSGATSTNYEADRGLREGCPSSPPLFNLYHAAVMNDFRQRRKRKAEAHNLEPGIPWKAIVDGKLKRRRTTFQAQKNSKVHIFGDIEFADDTATFATSAEFPHADQVLEQTFTDWGEKINRNKTEALSLKPAAVPDHARDHPQVSHKVRHVGGIISQSGGQWKDTLHRSIQGKLRAKEIAKAWSTGTHRGRGNTSRVKLLARLRVMRSVVIPTLTTFSRSRAWTRAQILMLQKTQNYALQRAFGLDKLAMHELHITNAQLHAAAQWPPIEEVIMEQSLRWLGHVARMPITRLPKLALFGTWLHAGTNSTHINTQTRWLATALTKAEIHHLEFFRLAQNKDTTKWDALLRKAFPKPRLTQAQGRILNAWRPGQPLPPSTPARIRQNRTVWTPLASTIPPKTCPACMRSFDTTAALNHHYLLNHAIIDPNLTTFQTFQCHECQQKFTTAFAKASHTCHTTFSVPHANSTDKFGHRPLNRPNILHIPPAWRLFTDGSFNPLHPNAAGWGVAVYDATDNQDQHCLFKLHGPVLLDDTDQRFLGAEQYSNNTGELSAIAEALIWLDEESPGSSHLPAEIVYDSQYAADITTGKATPHTNLTLAEHCHQLYKLISHKRPLTLRWIRGHSNSPGNDMADQLAHLGRTSTPTNQSKRWTAPHQHQLTTAKAETCRKCGRLFFGARKCARHERDCAGHPQADPDINFHPCRLCSQAFSTRKARNLHQAKCQGNPEDNLQCRYCSKLCDSNKQRISHEGKCPAKQAQSSDPTLWECPRCHWRILATHLNPSKLADAQQRHTQHCKGSEDANRTCSLCGKQWQNMTARLAHEAHCVTDEQARTCRCCGRLFNTKSGRVGHEKRKRQAGLL